MATKDEMKQNIYLADIDPNNSILPVMDIRRIIMFQLLIWDKIILSDSQFLTDPRLNILLGGYTSREVCQKYGISDVASRFKGIEALFENGFIEVACRANAGGESSLCATWEGMRSGKNSVPYLPGDEKYVKFLDELSFQSHEYKTSDLGEKFQAKLKKGIGMDPRKGGIVLGKNPTDDRLRGMFEEDTPLFRDIFDFLRTQLAEKEITKERFETIYDYVYSCYSGNVSDALNCNANTKFRHIPFHLDVGNPFGGEDIKPEELQEVKATWALNPLFLDCLSFEDFVELKKKLRTSKVREIYLGKVESPWKEVKNAWEEYIEILEDRIELALRKKQNMDASKLFKEYGIDKFIARPRQESMMSTSVEFSRIIVSSLVSNFPVVGQAFGALDTIRSIYGELVSFSRRKEKIEAAEGYKQCSQLLSDETRIVTRYTSEPEQQGDSGEEV